MPAPFSWNSFFHKCPPAKFVILQNKPCKISKLETGNWTYLLEVKYTKTGNSLSKK